MHECMPNSHLPVNKIFSCLSLEPENLREKVKNISVYMYKLYSVEKNMRIPSGSSPSINNN